MSQNPANRELQRQVISLHDDFKEKYCDLKSSMQEFKISMNQLNKKLDEHLISQAGQNEKVNALGIAIENERQERKKFQNTVHGAIITSVFALLGMVFTLLRGGKV